MTSTEENNPNAFASLHEVKEHLKAAGYRISKSKIYRDRDDGKIVVNEDGTVSELSVRAYAAEHLEQIGPSVDDLNNIQAMKAELEQEKLREQIERLRFSREKEMGKYVPSEDVDRRMVAILTIVDTSVRQMIDLNMSDLCRILGGNIGKINDGRDFLEEKLDETFNQLARTDQFSIQFQETG